MEGRVSDFYEPGATLTLGLRPTGLPVRLGELMEQQKATVGLAKGGNPE